MSNKIKCLLINLLLLAGVYCSWGCSCCADCCKECCGNGDNKETHIQVTQDGSNSNNNNEEKGQEDNKDDEEQKDLYFKIEGGAINSNGLGCFGELWFDEYEKTKDDANNAILLYKLTEQKNKQEEEAGTLVYSKELKYTNGVDFPKDLKDYNNRWAIFKVTTLKEDNNKKQKGNSHIFYCSDVSTLIIYGLFQDVHCYSIEILAANTQRVETFYSMFYDTYSYLEQSGTGRSGFIGLEKLDVSGAKELSYMFTSALFEQKTVNSLKDWILENGADISYMFSVKGNILSFKTLTEWIKRKDVSLVCSSGSKYEVFFEGEDNDQNNDKLPEWYKDRLQK